MIKNKGDYFIFKMKKIFFAFYFFVLLFCDAISQITEEERKNLFNKFVKKIDVLNPKDFIRPLNDIIFKKFSYDSNEIKKIISDHKFPENYNFFEDKKVQKHIKNQGSCGCGWAFASTSALGYRYSRDGEDINLSPQNVLSCFTKNCETLVHVLDAELHLAQKGTTTESCNPYSSADGKTIENCPTKCQGNDEFKIYYAKNTYSTILDYYDSEIYYKVVTLIMDQLVNSGPVTAQIDYYKDLVELGSKSNCKSTIYKYDGKSELVTSHAVVIVGYGHEDSKYYWIIQNSFGEDFCDGGLAKIEFNELGIENIAFNEPQTEIPSGKTFKAIMKLEENCKNSYTTDSEEYYDINFDLSFTSEDSQNQFYYQCGKNPKINEKGGICSFSYLNYIQNKRGFYKHSYT